MSLLITIESGSCWLAVMMDDGILRNLDQVCSQASHTQADNIINIIVEGVIPQTITSSLLPLVSGWLWLSCRGEERILLRTPYSVRSTL